MWRDKEYKWYLLNSASLNSALQLKAPLLLVRFLADTLFPLILRRDSKKQGKFPA